MRLWHPVAISCHTDCPYLLKLRNCENPTPIQLRVNCPQMFKSQVGHHRDTASVETSVAPGNQEKARRLGWVSQEADRLLLGTTSPVVAVFRNLFSRLATAPGGPAVWWAMAYLVVGVGLALAGMRTPQGAVAPAVGWVPYSYSTLIHVQVALAGAAIPILLFLMGMAREDRALPMAVNEVLVRDTQVLAVLAFGLAGVVHVVLDSVVHSNSVFYRKDLLFVCLWSVLLVAVTYVRTFRLLLQPSELARRSVAALTKKMEKSLRHSATVSIARALVAERLKNMGLKAGAPRERRDSYQNLEPCSEGIVIDLNLATLADVTKSIKAARPALEASAANSDEPRSTGRDAYEDLDLFLAVSVGDRIDSSQRGFLYVPSGAVSEPQRKGWERRLWGAVKVRGLEVDGPEVEFAEEMATLRDNLVVNISAGRLATVEKGLRLLTEITLSFAQRRKALEERVRSAAPVTFESLFDVYSPERFRSWEFLDQLLEESLISGRSELIRLTHGYPIRVAWRALGAGALDIFEEAIDWVPRFYLHSISRVPERLQGYVVDSAWRLIHETIHFQILRALDDSGVKEQKAGARFSLLAATKSMAKLLKMSFDAKRPGDFSAFAKGLERTRAAIQGRNLMPEHEHEWEGNDPTPDLLTAQMGDAVNEPSRTKAVAAAYIELSFLAMDAWITHKFDQGMIDEDGYLGWRSSIALPRKLRRLWELLIEAEELDVERVLGWDWWELEEHEEGTAYWTDFTFFLLQSVTVRSLELLAKASGIESSELTVPAHRNLRAWAGRADSSVGRWLADVEQKPEKWKKAVGGDVQALVAVLREKIAGALAQQEREELRTVIDAPISNDRVASIKQEVVMAWKEAATVRAIFGQCGGAIKRYESAPEGMLRFGYNVLEPREAYIEAEGSSFPNWGEQFGQGLGASENILVVSTLVSSASHAVAQVGSREELDAALELSVRALTAKGFSPVILLVDPPWWVESGLGLHLKRSRHEALMSERWYCGELEGRPVLRLHVGRESKGLLVDFSKAASWRQFVPRLVHAGDEILGNDLLFGLTEINEAKARELLAKQPDLAKDGEAEAETLLRLRAKVSVRVFETFDFQIVDKDAIRVFKFS